MNVLFISHWFPAISDTFVLNQMAGLLERGVDVSIYARWVGDTTKVHPAVERFGLLDRAMYAHEAREEHCDDLRLTALQRAYPELETYVRAFADAAGEETYSTSTRRLFYACLPVLRRAPFDIIHCQFGTLMEEGLLLKRATGSKLVVSFRGYDITAYVHQHGGGPYQRLFKEGDALLPNCEYFKRRLVGLGCGEEKITLLRSGNDTEQFPYNPCPLKPREAVRILTVARLVEKKGIAYAIQAVASLLQKGRALEYTIVGDGELRDELKELIDALGVQDHVRLVGAKQQRDIVELLGKSHLLIAPSVTAANGDQDGPANVLKEAMLTGLPVIGTNHGGIPEVIEDGVTGFIVPERDVAAMAGRIEYLLDHSERWLQMGKAGRALVEKQYDTNALNEELLAIYERLLGGKAA